MQNDQTTEADRTGAVPHVDVHLNSLLERFGASLTKDGIEATELCADALMHDA